MQLFMASQNGHVDAVRVLLEAKANVDLADEVILGVYIFACTFEGSGLACTMHLCKQRV